MFRLCFQRRDNICEIWGLRKAHKAFMSARSLNAIQAVEAAYHQSDNVCKNMNQPASPPNITPAWQVARPEPLFGPDFNPISGRKRDRNLERRLHTNFAICFLLFLPLNFLNQAFLSPLVLFVIFPFKVFCI